MRFLHENREECYQFFDDLCTVNELQSLSQRLQVAKMIKQGILTQQSKKNLVLLQQQYLSKTIITSNDAYK